MPGWIDQKYIDSIDFLPDELVPLRDYVLKHRNENISEELHVFEERALFPQISWDVIGIYEDEDFNNGGMKIFIGPDKRQLQKMFLKAALDLRLWIMGNKNKQIIRFINSLDEIGSNKNVLKSFFNNESIEFSFITYENFLERYLLIKPENRNQKLRIIPTRLSQNKKSKEWNVFCPLDLKSWYCGTNGKPAEEFSIEINGYGAMSNINFSNDGYATHASIANFISWQDFLHKYNIGKIIELNRDIYNKKINEL